MRNTPRGFLLIELVIVISFIAIISAISWPLYNNFLAKTRADNSARDIIEVLRRTQTKAQGSEVNTPWGVHVENDRVTLFSGASWNTRNSTYDEKQIMPSGIALNSSPTDIVFEKNGKTGAAGSITITGPDANTKTIIISNEGIIDIS